MDARWSNFFDLSGGCSKEGVLASCGSITNEGYMEAQTRAFFGDKWYDLPGNDDERERAEAAYVSRVQQAFADYRAAQKAKQKPKLSTALTPTTKSVGASMSQQATGYSFRRAVS